MSYRIGVTLNFHVREKIFTFLCTWKSSYSRIIIYVCEVIYVIYFLYSSILFLKPLQLNFLLFLGLYVDEAKYCCIPAACTRKIYINLLYKTNFGSWQILINLLKYGYKEFAAGDEVLNHYESVLEAVHSGITGIVIPPWTLQAGGRKTP